MACRDSGLLQFTTDQLLKLGTRGQSEGLGYVFRRAPNSLQVLDNPGALSGHRQVGEMGMDFLFPQVMRREQPVGNRSHLGRIHSEPLLPRFGHGHWTRLRNGSTQESEQTPKAQEPGASNPEPHLETKQPRTLLGYMDDDGTPLRTDLDKGDRRRSVDDSHEVTPSLGGAGLHQDPPGPASSCMPGKKERETQGKKRCDRNFGEPRGGSYRGSRAASVPTVRPAGRRSSGI